ncbi:MAG TPA: hypothetical protein ACQGQH_02970 [Xylella sp.]
MKALRAIADERLAGALNQRVVLEAPLHQYHQQHKKSISTSFRNYINKPETEFRFETPIVNRH